MDKTSGAGSKFMHGYEVRSLMSDKADKALDKANNFSVFGMKIPKFIFKDKKAAERIERSRAMADEMLRDMMDSLSKVFRKEA
jgi:hypothetical protein